MRMIYIWLLSIWNTVYNGIYRLLRIHPKVKNNIETLDYILEHHCSVSRYGDGELLIMDGWYIAFQKADSVLATRLKEIISTNHPNHIICLPNVFNDLSAYTDTAAMFWKAHLHSSLCKWCNWVAMDKQYYDTQISRFYIDVRDKSHLPMYVEKLKQIWKNREIVIVEGEKSRMGYRNDLFSHARSIRRVLGPAENAFSVYQTLLHTITEKVAKDALILIALGPTATVLAYDLCLEGYQAIDLGHLDVEYEWFKKGATKKCAIEGKYVNEVNSREVNEVTDPEFLSQIIAVVK